MQDISIRFTTKPKFQFFPRNYKKNSFFPTLPRFPEKNLTQACLVFVGNHAVSGLQIFKGISRGLVPPFSKNLMAALKP